MSLTKRVEVAEYPGVLDAEQRHKQQQEEEGHSEMLVPAHLEVSLVKELALGRAIEDPAAIAGGKVGRTQDTKGGIGDVRDAARVDAVWRWCNTSVGQAISRGVGSKGCSVARTTH